MQVVTEFYRTATLPTELNNTFLTLIPKKLAPTIPQDFPPISLCNVIYKIIAKSLANRIKDHLPNLIHPIQSAFIQGRRISTNIILTQEIIHSFNLSSWNQKAFLLKVDLAKAFDRTGISLPILLLNIISMLISFPCCMLASPLLQCRCSLMEGLLITFTLQGVSDRVALFLLIFLS
jgi:hypothetical protein